MPLSDFDYLLRDLKTAFGTEAIMRNGLRIEGRFLVDPFDVSQAPATEGLNVTQTMFYYEPKTKIAPPIRWPALGDMLIIRGLEYEIVKINKDDLGEHALGLLQTGRGIPGADPHDRTSPVPP